MLLITYYLVNYNWLTKGVEKFISGDLTWAIFVSVITLALISAYTYSIYYLILIIHKLRVSKFGFGSTLIEVGTNESNSVFNRYIDEIIYFFKKTEYKYIIFEDLDRFENLEIYERLKGLNLLLNSNQQLSDRRIVFIYALKDEIFVKKEGTVQVNNRTKFFDFIVPTLNIVHNSNAEEILKQYLTTEIGKTEMKEGLSELFIEDISLFINDMRILINICNEYKIFSEALSNSGINREKLFSFIVYKNMNPFDYSELLNNKGLIFSVLNIVGLENHEFYGKMGGVSAALEGNEFYEILENKNTDANIKSSLLKLSKNELLFFLVKHEYLDENYRDYLTFFYEGSLSQADAEYLRAVRNGIIGKECLELTNTKKVSKRILLKDINHISILNYDLIYFWILTNDVEKIRRIIKVIFEVKENNIYYFRLIEKMSADQKWKYIAYVINNGNYSKGFILEEKFCEDEPVLKLNYLISTIKSWQYIDNDFSSNHIFHLIETLEYLEENEPEQLIKVISREDYDTLLEKYEEYSSNPEIRAEDFTEVLQELKFNKIKIL